MTWSRVLPMRIVFVDCGLGIDEGRGTQNLGYLIGDRQIFRMWPDSNKEEDRVKYMDLIRK